MPTTLTLKNIPDGLYDRLKVAAVAHRRSLNREAIVCLESVLMPAALSTAEHLARAREVRVTPVGGGFFDPEEIDALKREGRP